MSDQPKVLIVDDDPAIGPLVTAICKQLGLICDDAPDGEAALEKIRSEVFDVVLLDLMMPNMSGNEVIAALRELPQTPAVIVLTAQGRKQMDALHIGDVVRAVVQKPFDLDKLSTLLVETAQAVHAARREKPDSK